MNVHSSRVAAPVTPAVVKCTLLLVCMYIAACGSDEDANPSPPSHDAATTPVETRTDAGYDAALAPHDAAAEAIDAAGSSTSDGGRLDAGSPNPAFDGGVPGHRADAGVSPQSDAALPDASTTDSAAMPTVIPTPVTAPYIWGLGLGVSDLPGAVKFYTDVMKMTVEKENVRRDDRIETTLYATQAKRGARLVLMSFDDKRNTRKITAKLVWQAPNPGAINTAARSHPDYVSRLNFGIVQFDGPDTYIQEVGSGFVSGTSGITTPFLIVAGFSVSDLAASRRFYTSLGMTESRTGSFPVTDASGSATITEYTVKWPEGSGLVLQDWSTARNSKDNPVKVVMFVPNAQATADKIVAAGGAVTKPAERTSVYDNRLLIVAKDPDGYLLELVQ